MFHTNNAYMNRNCKLDSSDDDIGAGYTNRSIKMLNQVGIAKLYIKARQRNIQRLLRYKDQLMALAIAHYRCDMSKQPAIYCHGLGAVYQDNTRALSV